MKDGFVKLRVHAPSGHNLLKLMQACGYMPPPAEKPNRLDAIEERLERLEASVYPTGIPARAE